MAYPRRSSRPTLDQAIQVIHIEANKDETLVPVSQALIVRDAAIEKKQAQDASRDDYKGPGSKPYVKRY